MHTYIEYLKEKALDPKTITTYQNALSLFRDWYEGFYKELYKDNHVVPITLQEYQAYLMEERFAASSIQLYMVVLKNFFKFLKDEDLIQSDPGKNIRILKAARNVPKWLNRIQQHSFRRALEKRTVWKGSCRDEAIGKFLIGTALRIFEASNVQMKDIELSERKGHVKVYKGKGNKYREVPLNHEVRKILFRWIEERKNHKYGYSSYLFITERSIRISTRQIHRIIDDVLHEAKLKDEEDDFTPHSLRHTCLKELSKKFPSELVAEIAGHSDLSSTRIYTAMSKEELGNAMESISWG